VSSRSAALLATRLPGTGAIVAGLAVAVVVVAALAPVIRRDPRAFPLLAVFTLPFRVPIATDGRTVNLLVPLYLVVAAGTLTLLLPRWLGRSRASTRAGAPARPEEASAAPLRPAQARPTLRRPRTWLTPRGLEWILLAAVALYVLQASYSADRVKALENVAFFYVPFGLLFLLLRDVRWTRELIARCLGVAVTLAVLFAGVGFVEYARKSLFLNPKVVAADQYSNYFRVNSVFFDPSIYGRFLALVMIAVMTAVLAAGRGLGGPGAGPDERALRARRGQVHARREMLAGAAVLAWLLGGMVTSFSQSSIAALLLGLAVLAAWSWGVRPTLYVSGTLLVLALAFVLLAPASLHFGLKGAKGSAANATSGRTTLIGGGLELFAKRPLEGYGSGSFETEYKRHSATDAANAASASHTIPITIAAEQGVVGLALYASLLVSAFAVLFRGAGRSPPRIAIAACFAALVLHTWTYADFLEDPFTWALLAAGLALARAGGAGAGGAGVPVREADAPVGSV